MNARVLSEIVDILLEVSVTIVYHRSNVGGLRRLALLPIRRHGHFLVHLVRLLANGA